MEEPGEWEKWEGSTGGQALFGEGWRTVMSHVDGERERGSDKEERE
jgi:hypothetical protein